ncbi:putative glucan endo-1,3-beta-D-glucosidase [Medicago truncatula]|uniref:Carbohydrate-binding X8 domain protein n=1 Tax=Medicago truncatula TaxID=3880 RepID=G7IB18_MEDTR|nr:extensin [Medicago truncatula]AES63104.2 carbohydrate-binding X8 domain protein [Medicago truncatula]RHN82799.1 putative glucan endo-1,3-beta-D-glucosidase [Medicago truncatula]
MATSKGRRSARMLLFCLTLATISLTHCDANRSIRLLKAPKHRRIVINKNPKKLKIMKHFDFDPSIYSSNAQPYGISSPLSLPPYESLAPGKSPPYCVYPPPSSSTPSTTIPTPTSSQPTQPSPPYTSPDLPSQSPPPGPTTVTPSPPENFPTPTPEIVPSPPDNFPTPTPEIVPSPPSNIPGSPEPILNPPIIFPGPPGPSMSPPYFEPAPPYYEPTPPFIPSPTGGSGSIPSPPSTFQSPSGGTIPSPTVYQPPVVYPPPSVPPRSNTAPQASLWCVAKASVPDPIIEEAMNYACWSGADCSSIQPNGPCFQPDSVFAHASYAFNSYWQRTKASGGTCEFGGTAVLVSVDPSYDGCHFIYN